jgi:hypothetical protein
MTLPKFDAYDPPMALQNRSINICNAFFAAEYCCDPVNQPANNLFGQIENRWLDSKEHKYWQSSMPAKTPPMLKRHQSQPSVCNGSTMLGLIKTHGDFLAAGQFLFHAGAWLAHDFETTAPLSTSISPGPALMNGRWQGKAHRFGSLDLWVLEVASSRVQAFVFKHRGNVKHKQELEVLLPPGIFLSHQSTKVVTTKFPSSDANGLTKMLTVSVVHLKVA